jgi:hypothetical protein
MIETPSGKASPIPTTSKTEKEVETTVTETRKVTPATGEVTMEVEEAEDRGIIRTMEEIT